MINNELRNQLANAVQKGVDYLNLNYGGIVNINYN